MKALNLQQMELLEGGLTNRNCMILAGVTIVSFAAGGFLVGLAAIGASAAGDCF